MTHEPGQREMMIDRARSVAAGFADVGLTQAEEWLRRLSPEGREQARRDRQAKARRRRRLLLRLILSAIGSLLVWALLTAIAPAGVASLAASALMLVLMTIILVRAEPAAPGREALAQARLTGLAEEAIVWLGAQRRGLPSAALPLADAMSHRLNELSPALSRLDPNGPAAAAMHKLIAVELPDLVDNWRSVPISARRTPLTDGRSADDHLVNGLRLIDAELVRTSTQYRSETFDGIAVHGRYLELKYRDGGPLD